MSSNNTSRFYKKWWFWMIMFIIIVRACNKTNISAPNNKANKVQESKIDIIKILGTSAHTFIKDSNERYASLYAEWPQNITLSIDSTFVIRCHLQTCGDYDMSGTWGEPIKIDFYDEQHLPYDIRRNAEWFRKGELIKVPLIFNPVDKKRCETNTFTGFRESLLPQEIYSFMLIHHSNEGNQYIPYLFSSFIANRDYSGRGTTMVSIFDMSK